MGALAEDPGSVSRPTWQLTAICNSSPRGSLALFYPLRALGMHAGKTIHIVNTINKSLKN